MEYIYGGEYIIWEWGLELRAYYNISSIAGSFLEHADKSGLKEGVMQGIPG